MVRFSVKNIVMQHFGVINRQFSASMSKKVKEIYPRSNFLNCFAFVLGRVNLRQEIGKFER